MKLKTTKTKLKHTPEYFLKKAGYRPIFDRKKRKETFVKPTGGRRYPRLHIYIKTKKEHITFELHLDQKRPSYPGQKAHSGEYEGPVVEQEITRLKSLI